MDPFVTGSLISAGSSLLGGLFGGPDPVGQQIGLQKSLDKQRPGWIRYGAEKAGFNPLVFAGPTGLAGTLPTGPGLMGDAIARAGAAISDGFSEKAQLDMQKAELEVERQRLEALREEVKLAPNVPGIYNGNRQAGSGVGGRQSGGSAAPAGAAKPAGPDWELRPDGPSELNKNIAPRFSMFGKDFRGSGAFSSGEVFEDAIGENLLLSTLTAPLVFSDSVGHTYGTDAEKRKDSRLMSEWLYREKNKLPVTEELPPAWKSGKSPEEIRKAKEKYAEEMRRKMGNTWYLP
ncbi:hypothetical protein KZZ07_13060 [Mameliella sp. CS4]|uniref:hypothetical protein n=1 Tax=Mameliella sp. CS4 TaxID=2862329 RepID=UPI001C5CD1B9|nr:hypothetical protein [Mameliella sp. CS4]MBW4983471.1 hypothetical protein [Mameliella sp. CS4]